MDFPILGLGPPDQSCFLIHFEEAGILEIHMATVHQSFKFTTDK